MSQARVFSAFLKQIIKTKPQQSAYFSSKSVLQSSVGIIFKCKMNEAFKFETINHLLQNEKKIQNVQVLMVQRAGFQRDINAYNIVFPGGQNEPAQSDLEACTREVQEEVSLNVNSQCLYVGQIPRNFYYSKKRGRTVYISCHVFVLKPSSSFQPVLNQQQLVEYRWVALHQLYDQSNFRKYDARQFAFFKRLGWQFLRNSIQNNLKQVSFPGLNVGMNRDLWGLTLWLVGYMLQMSAENIRVEKQSESDLLFVENMETIKKQMREMTIVFNKSYIVGIPMVWMAKSWHYFNRVRQFTYKKSQTKLQLTLVAVLVLFTVILITLLR